jgi:MFS family permease
MQKYILELTVFLSGFIVLTYEVVGARILGPYYGTSTFVWTAMIGIILASLSIGYYIGGRLADRKDARIEHLANMILYAGLAIAVTYIIRKPLLEILSQSTHDIRIGSVIAAIILFLPASILLGMVSPYAVKLRIE